MNAVKSNLNSNVCCAERRFITSFRSILIHWKMYVHQPNTTSRTGKLKAYSRKPNTQLENDIFNSPFLLIFTLFQNATLSLNTNISANI